MLTQETKVTSICCFGFISIAGVVLLSSAAVLIAIPFSLTNAVVVDGATLVGICGGAPEDLGNCCTAGSNGCGGWINGCQNTKYKCKNANSCTAGTIKQNIYGIDYQQAGCVSAMGAKGTINLQAIVCYQTVTCPNSCTQNGKFFYCDAGNNPVPGPQVTPTQPDNTTCP